MTEEKVKNKAIKNLKKELSDAYKKGTNVAGIMTSPKFSCFDIVTQEQICKEFKYTYAYIEYLECLLDGIC